MFSTLSPVMFYILPLEMFYILHPVMFSTLAPVMVYILPSCNVLYTAPLKCPTYCPFVMFSVMFSVMFYIQPPVLPPVVCRVSWPGKSCRSIWPSAPPDCPQSTETHCPLSANTAAVGASVGSHPTSRGVISVAPPPSTSIHVGPLAQSKRGNYFWRQKQET